MATTGNDRIGEQLQSLFSTSDKARNNINEFRNTLLAKLESVNANVETLNRELIQEDEGATELSVTGVMLWEQCLRRTRDAITILAQQHRDMHGSISRIGKEIDKALTADITGVCRKEEQYEKSAAKRERINALIVQRLINQGLFDIAETLKLESGVSVDKLQKGHFTEINDIVNAIRAHDLGPAIRWLETHATQIVGNNLALRVHCQQFIQLALGDRRAQYSAIKYARQYLQPYAHEYPRVVRHLLGMLVFADDKGSLASNPRYAALIDDSRWLDLADFFVQETCHILRLPLNDPLTTVLSAGTSAVPQLLTLSQVMQSRQVKNHVWSSHQEELPIKITLRPSEQQAYHSVFSCPILKQQTTESNPPVRLTCGHCISKDALTRLQHNNRLKCPYCPLESLLADTLELHF